MMPRLVITLVTLWIFVMGCTTTVEPPASAESRASSFFPIGIYGTDKVNDPFNTVRSHGFNTVIVPPDPEILKRVSDAHLRAIVKFPMTEAALGSEEFFAEQLLAMKKQIATLKHDPVILAWYVFDEPDEHRIPIERIKTVVKTVKSIDSNGKTFGVFTRPERWISYLEYFDIISIDPYLLNSQRGKRVYETSDKVGNWIVRVRNDLSSIGKSNKSLWVIIQTFEYRYNNPDAISPFKQPLLIADVDEMLHQAIDNHADGVLMYTLYLKGGINAQTKQPFETFRLIDDRPDLWQFLSGIDRRMMEYRTRR